MNLTKNSGAGSNLIPHPLLLSIKERGEGVRGQIYDLKEMFC
jgi:hypothetical protein